MAHSNINFIWNKFDMLTSSVTEYMDILVISKTKFDDSFLHVLYHL